MKWIIDIQPNQISVYEEGNPENYAFREKADIQYGELGEIIGFKLRDEYIRQAYKICDILNNKC